LVRRNAFYRKVDFFLSIAYTIIRILSFYIIIRILGGNMMSEFEQDVQCKRNDVIDSGVGFIASFGFFAILFIIATLVQFIGS
jgi:hypothetical protein